MKVLKSLRPSADVQHQAFPARPPRGSGQSRQAAGEPPAAKNGTKDFRAIYDEWFGDVSRWIRALGGPDADRDDIAQEVFMVVRRRLHTFDGGNVAGWLYRITRRQVRDFRRRTWVKHIFSRRTGDPDVLPHGEEGPGDALERKERQRILFTLMDKMKEERRATFLLFEIEGMSGEQIAELYNVPVNTVWTRLHAARKEFFARAARYLKTQERERAHREGRGR